MIINIQKTPLLLGRCYKINHITFDGCHYFCTLTNQKGILKLDHSYQLVEFVQTAKKYDCICYDWHHHLFWASSICSGQLFCLDHNLNEVDALCIYGTGHLGKMTGIAYDCCQNCLILSFNNKIIFFKPESGEVGELCFPLEGWIVGVSKICNYYLIIVMEEYEYHLICFDLCLRQIGYYSFGTGIVPGNLIYNPCMLFSDTPSLEVYVKKSCEYPYIYQYGLPSCSLPITPCCCCNFCQEPNHPTPYKPDPCGDLIESIAMVETAISHILNAEGEKVQKVLTESNDINHILCINHSVNQTITQITYLEQVLYNKLQTALNGNCIFSGDTGCCTTEILSNHNSNNSCHDQQ